VYVYMFGPIDNAAVDEDISDWRRAVGHSLSNHGAVVFDPLGAFLWSDPDAVESRYGQNIVAIDEFALRRADMLVGVLTPSSVGSCREVQMALDARIPVFAALHRPNRSPFLHDSRINTFDGITEMVEASKQYMTDRRVGLPSGAPHPPHQIVFQALDSGAPCSQPTRAFSGDAGFDLAASRDVRVKPGIRLDMLTNLRMALPPGFWGLIMGRSSTFKIRGIQVIPSVIDHGYRGPLYVQLWNPSREAVVDIKEGERVAQVIPLPLFHGESVVGEVDLGTERGLRGFGSTGLGNGGLLL